MKTRILITVLAFGQMMAIGANSASVYSESYDCVVPMSQWQPRHLVKQMVEDKGWKLRRIKIDDGCYEVFGWDENDQEFELKVDPGSLEIIKFEFESYSTEMNKDHDTDTEEKVNHE